MTVLRPHKNSATYDRLNVTHQTQLTVATAQTFRRLPIGLKLRFPDNLYAAGDEQGKRYHLGTRTMEQYSHRWDAATFYDYLLHHCQVRLQLHTTD